MNKVSSFDPDKYVKPAARTPKVVPLYATPKEWSHGLTLLADRAAPGGIDRDRWKQIVSDATKIATVWLHRVEPGGWTIENLFGFDLRLPGGELGLAFAIGGGELLSVDPEEAVIVHPDWVAIHRPRVPAGSALIWNFNERNMINVR